MRDISDNRTLEMFGPDDALDAALDALHRQRYRARLGRAPDCADPDHPGCPDCADEDDDEAGA